MNFNLSCVKEGFLGGTIGKEPACPCRRHKRLGFGPWVRKILWMWAWQNTPVFLPGESHGQRILAGYSSLGSKRVGHGWVTETHTRGLPASVCLQWDSKFQSYCLAGLLPPLETQMQPISVVPPDPHTQERGRLFPGVYVSSSACSLRLENYRRVSTLGNPRV